MTSGIQNIWRIPELRARILFTFGMLAVYRIGCVVVTPGINSQVIKDFFAQMQGTVFGLMNLFSGGAMEQLSIFALGIMPYISATIIFQLLTVVIPALEALKKEGEQGQKKINQWSIPSIVHNPDESFEEMQVRFEQHSTFVIRIRKGMQSV